MVKRGGIKRRHPLVLSALIGLLLGLSCIICANKLIRPTVITVARDHLSNQISGQIHDVVNAELLAEGISYQDICTLHLDGQGNVVALQTDMAKLSQLKSTITTQVVQEFDNSLLSQVVELPLGSILPAVPFSGLGPGLKIRVLSVGDISAEFENEFISDGINQTLHRVVLTVTADIRLLLPGGVYSYTDKTQMILAETVLLGDVPESYFDLNASRGMYDG